MVLMDYYGTVVWKADGDLTDGMLSSWILGILLWKAQLVRSFDKVLIHLHTLWYPPTQLITASTELVSAIQLHDPDHYVFHFNDMSILSLIYNDPDVSDIYWPDAGTPFYDNSRKRYNNTRLGVLDDLDQFVSGDFGVQQALCGF